jgi:hypothetical protein
MVSVYWKANGDFSFRAILEDVVGLWNCTDIQYNIGYTANMTGNAIFISLK